MVRNTVASFNMGPTYLVVLVLTIYYWVYHMANCRYLELIPVFTQCHIGNVYHGQLTFTFLGADWAFAQSCQSIPWLKLVHCGK